VVHGLQKSSRVSRCHFCRSPSPSKHPVHDWGHLIPPLLFCRQRQPELELTADRSILCIPYIPQSLFSTRTNMLTTSTF
jgi:hypothetical protein